MIGRAHRTGGGTTYIKCVFFTVRVGYGVRRYGLHAGSRVAFMPEIDEESEFRVPDYLLVEKIIRVCILL